MHYFSNCLLMAIYIRLKFKGSKLHSVNSKYSPFPHFCVEYKNKVIWFKARYSDEPWYHHLWYEGGISFRNKKKKSH